MKSSSGLYVSRLDHVRAAAAFLVYFWHFVHVNVPFDLVPAFPPLSVLEEGHAGVALFMTLSGYLFAKIIDGRPISLARFYWNRLLRLVPLLALVLAYWLWRGRLTPEGILPGLVLSSWPGGTWSIVVELHFYILLPLILALQQKNRLAPLAALLVLSLSVRTGVWLAGEDIRSFAYFTLGGCLDLFVLGMAWHEFAKSGRVRRHAGALLALAAAMFIALWHAFNLMGGFQGTGSDSPAAWVWIVIPFGQGLLLGAMIVGYEYSGISIPRMADRAMAKVGEVSYSIYLLHFIAFTPLAKACAGLGLPMDNLAVSGAMAVATFPVMVLAGTISYHLVEKPFLALRCGYGKSTAATAERPLPANGAVLANSASAA